LVKRNDFKWLTLSTSIANVTENFYLWTQVNAMYSCRLTFKLK
jgi:hypothetical protein